MADEPDKQEFKWNYLGDGVYARFIEDTDTLLLITGTPEDISNKIYLEPQVLTDLFRMYKRYLRQMLANYTYLKFRESQNPINPEQLPNNGMLD